MIGKSLALQAVARSVRHDKRRVPPHTLCVPLRALELGYYCFALRALSLRDGVPPFGRL